MKKNGKIFLFFLSSLLIMGCYSHLSLYYLIYTSSKTYFTQSFCVNKQSPHCQGSCHLSKLMTQDTQKKGQEASSTAAQQLSDWQEKLSKAQTYFNTLSNRKGTSTHTYIVKISPSTFYSTLLYGQPWRPPQDNKTIV